MPVPQPMSSTTYENGIKFQFRSVRMNTLFCRFRLPFPWRGVYCDTWHFDRSMCEPRLSASPHECRNAHRNRNSSRAMSSHPEPFRVPFSAYRHHWLPPPSIPCSRRWSPKNRKKKEIRFDSVVWRVLCLFVTVAGPLIHAISIPFTHLKNITTQNSQHRNTRCQQLRPQTQP